MSLIPAPSYENVTKLVIPLLFAVILGLIGVIWELNNGRMEELRGRMNTLQQEMGGQRELTQQKYVDIAHNLDLLTQRVADLVDLLNKPGQQVPKR
jgi:hypothetical protein